MASETRMQRLGRDCCTVYAQAANAAAIFWELPSATCTYCIKMIDMYASHLSALDDSYVVALDDSIDTDYISSLFCKLTLMQYKEKDLTWMNLLCHCLSTVVNQASKEIREIVANTLSSIVQALEEPLSWISSLPSITSPPPSVPCSKKVLHDMARPKLLIEVPLLNQCKKILGFDYFVHKLLDSTCELVHDTLCEPVIDHYSYFMPCITQDTNLYDQEFKPDTTSIKPDGNYSFQSMVCMEESGSQGQPSKKKPLVQSQEKPPKPHCPGPPLLTLTLCILLLLAKVWQSTAHVTAEIQLVVCMLQTRASAQLLRIIHVFIISLSEFFCRSFKAFMCSMCFWLCVVVLWLFFLAVVFSLVIVRITPTTASRKAKSSFVFLVFCMFSFTSAVPLDQPDDHTEVHIRGARSAGGAIFAPLKGAPNTGYSVTINLGKKNPQEVYKHNLNFCNIMI